MSFVLWQPVTSGTESYLGIINSRWTLGNCHLRQGASMGIVAVGRIGTYKFGCQKITGATIDTTRLCVSRAFVSVMPTSALSGYSIRRGTVNVYLST